MSTDYNDWKEKQKCFKGIQNYHKECKSMTNGLPRNLKVTVNCSKFDKKKTYKAAIKLHHKKIRLKKKQKKKNNCKDTMQQLKEMQVSPKYAKGDTKCQ